MALGQKVPLLSEYLKLLPPSTQKEDIDNLRPALTRLPKRIVVLLDEIDRMEKEELIVLLKVVRGISTLANLTFVCAGDIETILGYRDKNTSVLSKVFSRDRNCQGA
jgi:predicted KAP-like P-loop ATPase